MTHYKVKCHWCDVELNKRKDAYQREINQRGFCQCRKCFGRNPSFQEARKRIMTESNPFKGKKHSEDIKKRLSLLKIGKASWNKGLNKFISLSISIQGRTHSEKHKGRYVGAKNPNWKGGITPIKRPITPDFKKWLKFRLSILKQQGNICAKCEKRFLSNQLDVHHILPRREYKHLEYDRHNCICLCKSCHKEFHKRFGRKNIDPSSTLKFIDENKPFLCPH